MNKDLLNWSAKHLFFYWIAVLFVASAAFAQNLPVDSPILISQPDSTRALTGGFKRKTQNLFANRQLVTVYVTNLDLLPNEGANAFRADVEDSNHYRYPVQVVNFEKTAERPWVYALTFRLHDRLGSVGDVLLRITWRGMSSNRVRLAVGFEGGKIEDDRGARPTPMPEKPIFPADSGENAVGLRWSGDRVRFMEQSTFGPNAATEMRLRRIGLSTWLNEQMEEKRDGNGALRYSLYPYPDLALQQSSPPTNCNSQCLRDNYSMYLLQNWFFREALYGDDFQLRRRVAWAMSQIWVVSGRETSQPSRMIPYLKILDRHAFGSYRDLMREMTLNPAMGNYLDMAISTRANPNENYAREILQLFSVGLYMLNQDGTLKLDGQGNLIPTYDQDVVNGFTKVFTGWTFCDVGCPGSQLGIKNYIDPMRLFPANHDVGDKAVLNYPGSVPVIFGGLSAEQDLELALDNIFYHPNVGPFVGKLLIQQLVTSNPTPAYVGRVATAFNNNGQGLRGDMKAVVRAILTDPEARGNIKTDPDFGKLREPVLFVTNTVRPFEPAAQPNGLGSCVGLSDGVINGATSTLAQDVFMPPSVFNYYSMENTLPNSNIIAPEFGIFSTGNALKRANYLNSMLFAGGIQSSGTSPCGTRINIARFEALAAADPSGVSLVDSLGREMLHGSMSSQMREHILEAVVAVAPENSLKRARTAIYLVGSSPQFQVQR